jgi:hypothetical protein
VANRGKPVLAICSSAFIKLGRSQAKALGYPDLPIAMIQHPFGAANRDEVQKMAGPCLDEILRLVR